MPRIPTLIFAAAIATILFSCSKKTTPSAATPTITSTDSVTVAATTPDSAVSKKTVIYKRPKATVPKVIAVSDKAAKKSVDGRYYYDLQGHRYWRSNKDGKYYIYNKSMNTDPDFKATNN